jgi:hypothetical protein
MHLTIPIETAPTILYTSIHATHYRTTGLPVLEYYVDNTRYQTTISYLTSLHFIVNFTFIILSSSSSCFSVIFAGDIFVLTPLTTAIAKNNYNTDSTDPLEFSYACLLLVFCM